MKKLPIIAALTAMAVLPLLAMAQAGAAGGGVGIPGNVQFVQSKGTGVQQLVDILNTVASIILYAVLTLAGIFIVYAAYLYLTAAGDTEKVKQASTVIIYAVVAIGVGLLSRVIVAIAQSLVKP